MFKYSLVTFFLIPFSFVYGKGWVFTDLQRSPDVPGNDIEHRDASLSIFSLIYPGTKWCGAGNVAENYDDLGIERETDICCREHDHCPDFMNGFQTKDNLTNMNFYTRVSCQCDEKFRHCLHDTNSTTSDNVGEIYFDMLATKCFRKDYPITGCKRQAGFVKKKCAEYTYDTSAEKKLQWFDVLDYWDR